MYEHQQIQQSQNLKSSFQRRTTSANKTHLSSLTSIIQRSRINPKFLTSADVLQLQCTIGNRAVGRLFSEIKNSPTDQQIPIQRQEIPEEEEPLQGKFESRPEEETCPACMQRQEIPEEEEPLQSKMADPVQRQKIPEEEKPLQTKRENNTGLPDNLKAGVESLSGIDMSDVRVHYNSLKPAKVEALAYTQGTNIHVAPGQERHLPHEAWHVVQQKQGRVKPTVQFKEVALNDDVALEEEADKMGKRAVQMKTKISTFMRQESNVNDRYSGSSKLTIQRLEDNIPDYKEQTVKFSTKNKIKNVILDATVGKKSTIILNPSIGHPKQGSEPKILGSDDLLYKELEKKHPKETFIRGHLLNADLGGFGIAKNLFPITSSANHNHLEQVETTAKTLVANRNKILYEVEAIPKNSNNFDMNPDSELKCKIDLLVPPTNTPLTIVNQTIESIPRIKGPSLKQRLEPMKYRTKGRGMRKKFVVVNTKNLALVVKDLAKRKSISDILNQPGVNNVIINTRTLKVVATN